MSSEEDFEPSRHFKRKQAKPSRVSTDSNEPRKKQKADKKFKEGLDKLTDRIAKEYGTNADELLKRYLASRFETDQLFRDDIISIIGEQNNLAATLLKSALGGNTDKREQLAQSFSVKERLCLTYAAFETLRQNLNLSTTLPGIKALKAFAKE
jgi:hypothetical protein